MFHIGHPAYNGINRLSIEHNFPAAVRELVSRGANDTEAKAAVKKATQGYFATVQTPNGVVEISHHQS